MIALGTFWSLLSICHRHFQLSIFSIPRAHTMKKTCSQIKKKKKKSISLSGVTSPHLREPLFALESPSQQTVPWVSRGGNIRITIFSLFSLTSVLSSPSPKVLWIILTTSLFWISLNHFYLYAGLYQHLFWIIEELLNWPSTSGLAPLTLSPE